MLYLLFLRDKYERKLLLEEGNNKQSQSKLFNELKVDCVQIEVENQLKKSFLKNEGLLSGAREKVKNYFRSRIFPMKNLG